LPEKLPSLMRNETEIQDWANILNKLAEGGDIGEFDPSDWQEQEEPSIAGTTVMSQVVEDENPNEETETVEELYFDDDSPSPFFTTKDDAASVSAMLRDLATHAVDVVEMMQPQELAMSMTAFTFQLSSFQPSQELLQKMEHQIFTKIDQFGKSDLEKVFDAFAMLPGYTLQPQTQQAILARLDTTKQ
jgi:hypothetical protein